jgi:tetratricopeptide (TPR) repeat protein
MPRLFVLCLLLSGSLAAQLNQQSPNSVQRLSVRVAFSGGEACDSSVRVSLVGLDGPVDQGFINSKCVVQFSNVPQGSYRISVSGRGFANVDTNVVVDLPGQQEVEVKVTRGDSGNASSAPANQWIAAADLQVPSKAKKEYDKANQLIKKRDWSNARNRLNQAITLYPNYAAAYNGLGVVYSQLGDAARERESLEKAVGIDDHFVPAYLNLGKMDIKTGDFPGAEAALNKASALDPNEAQILVLLTYAEFEDRHFDEAIATCHRAHSTPQAPHALVHWVAAHALEQEHRNSEAQTELRIFLSEEQTGPRADAARKELADQLATAR